MRPSIGMVWVHQRAGRRNKRAAICGPELVKKGRRAVGTELCGGCHHEAKAQEQSRGTLAQKNRLQSNFCDRSHEVQGTVYGHEPGAHR